METIRETAYLLRDCADAGGRKRSHSVPGLAAKDVIDVQVSVDSLDLDQKMRRAFDEAGFPMR